MLEQVVARHPAGQEAKLLGVTQTAPMLALYVTACGTRETRWRRAKARACGS
ncbi:MAG TPA: hypothetical protein VII22_25225 [Streptosporangiaceae bacterium]